MSEQTSSTKMTLGLILSWIFGIIFALDGIFSVFSKPIPGIIMLIMAAVLLPPIAKLVDQKWKFHLSGVMKILIVIIGLIIFGATSGTSNVSKIQQAETQKEEQQITNNEPTTNDTNTANQVNEEQPKIKTNEQQNNETETIPTQNETLSQKNAVRKAKSYLEMSAFSRSGLIKQLEFEKFSTEDAVYAVDKIGADWNKQAERKAKSYLEMSGFSRDSLIKQLEFEGFTSAQAIYGVDAIGL